MHYANPDHVKWTRDKIAELGREGFDRHCAELAYPMAFRASAAQLKLPRKRRSR